MSNPIDTEYATIYQTPQERRAAMTRLLKSALESAAELSAKGVSATDKQIHALIMSSRSVVECLLITEGDR